MKVGIVGGGVFGLAAALELVARGHLVTVVERDVIPADKAASNDASKTIQRLYGRRELYVELAERADVQWRRWQEQIGDTFYYPIGHLLVTRGFGPGSRAYDSYATLTTRGNPLQILSPAEARERFPQISYHEQDAVLFDPWGGYLASGRALAALARLARAAGVTIRERTPVRAIAEQCAAVRI